LIGTECQKRQKEGPKPDSASGSESGEELFGGRHEDFTGAEQYEFGCYSFTTNEGAYYCTR